MKNTFSRGFCGFRHRNDGDFARDEIAFKPSPNSPRKEGAVALTPIKNTNRSLPKGIERFAAFVYNKIAKHHQQESEDIIPQ